MSQATTWGNPTIGPSAPSAYAAQEKQSFDALLSKHSGSSRPTYAVLGTEWADTSVAGKISVKVYDGTGASGDRLIYTIDTATGVKTFAAFDLSADPASAMQAGTKQYIDAVAALRARNMFAKLDTSTVAFLKTGAGTASLKAGTVIEVNSTVYNFTANTAITMPSLTAGTDYAIWIAPDGSLSATTSFTSPPVTNARLIGGFHYAPGGNATGTSGGDTTPAINNYSFWDLKFRPACPNPCGMVLVAGSFWCDIYLLGVDHLVNGTSKYNVTIADGASPPRIPLLFGGNGTMTYSTLTWWEAAEVMQNHGKRLLSYADFAAAAYGITENSSGGTDPASTILRQAYTSKWGVMLASGNMWVWGDEFGGPGAGAAWANTNGGRGQVYQQSNALILGGFWGNAANSGSRASGWLVLPSNSGSDIGARGRCEHLTLV